MRKICVINRKGGVGKTTTTINVAVGLARAGKRVLVIDFDPQGNVGDCLPVSESLDIYNFLIENAPFDRCVQEVQENLWVMPARETLTKAELILSGETSRETFLKRKLEDVNGYDYVLIDCPPSLGLLNQNGLLYADEAIIPTSTDTLGIEALNKMVEAMETLNDVFGHHLEVAAIVPTMFDARLKTCRESLNEIQTSFYEKVSAPVRTNSKLREAPRAGKSIFDYAGSSRGAKDYQQVIDFILNQRADLEPVAVMASVKA